MSDQAAAIELRLLGSNEKAKTSARFFKTGAGHYGEGDVFIGVSMPDQRKLAKAYLSLTLKDLDELLTSKVHEERSLALIILTNQYAHGKETEKQSIYDFYVDHLKYVNNWDLVDGSAEKIIGPWLEDKDKKLLFELAKSDNIWERRVAVLSTFHYIKKGKSDTALEIISILINDKHDLIQKAVGWMLREIGKRCSPKEEEAFLKNYYKTMPRTALRYAIERFPKPRQHLYLSGKI